MFCPVCKAEYKRGVTICSDCGAKLIPKPPEPRQVLYREMVNLYSPISEVELAMLKSVLEADGIEYFVKNETFGSLKTGIQIPLVNGRIIMCPTDQYERASELIRDYLGRTAPKEDDEGQGYSLLDKIRMVLEILLFGWVMPGRKSKKKEQSD
jgi:Putative prokaryotic signal transducing protein